MNTVHDIDITIEEYKRKYFANDLSEDQKKTITEAKNLINKADIKHIVQIDCENLLLELNNCIDKMGKIVFIAEARNNFAEKYRKLDHAEKYIKHIGEGMKQGIATQQVIKDLRSELELEIVTEYIYKNFRAIYNTLERTITIIQSLMKYHTRDYTVQAKQ
jgi:uncharacterized FlgJ-related protein